MKKVRYVLDKLKRLAAGLEVRAESVWPGLVNDLFVAHLSIYDFFSIFVRGRAVLDAGCGVGYGPNRLAEAGANSVIGVDLCRKSIRYAQRTYRSPKIRFLICNLVDLELAEDSVDCVVSSNALEHLANPSVFIARMSLWISSNGCAVLAVPPIVNEDQAAHNEQNHFHRSTLTPHEWSSLFEHYRWSVRCYRHDFKPGIEKLDFSSMATSTYKTNDFQFERCSLDELYTLPTLTAIFHLSKT